jgi:hypothetical protein
MPRIPGKVQLTYGKSLINSHLVELRGGLNPESVEFLESEGSREAAKEADMALSFATDIRPLFRAGDVACMKKAGVALDDPAWMCVAANAKEVYGAVSAGKMPPDEPWPAERVALFKQWMDAGCPA